MSSMAKVKCLELEEVAATLTREFLDAKMSDFMYGEGFSRVMDVRPLSEIPTRELVTCRVKRVVSPSEFYLDFDLGPGMKRYDEWYPEMQDYYGDQENRYEMSLQSGAVAQGRCYVARIKSDNNKWHRVRALDVDLKRKLVLAFLCDFGKLQSVKFEDLLELDHNFVKWQSQCNRAYLYDLLPATTAGGDLSWSADACAYFKDLVNEKEFAVVVLGRTKSVVKKGLADFYADLGVVLLEKSLPLKKVLEEAAGTINSLMVQKRFARAVGIFGTCDPIMVLKKCIHIPYFSPLLKEDLVSKAMQLGRGKDSTTMSVTNIF